MLRLTHSLTHSLARSSSTCFPPTPLLLANQVDVLLHPLKSELNFPIGHRDKIDLFGYRWELPIFILDAIVSTRDELARGKAGAGGRGEEEGGEGGEGGEDGGSESVVFNAVVHRDANHGLGVVLEHEGEGEFEVTIGEMMPGLPFDVAVSNDGRGLKPALDDTLTHVNGVPIYGIPFDEVVGMLGAAQLEITFSREGDTLAPLGGGAAVTESAVKAKIMKRGSNLFEGGILPASPTLTLPETKGMRMNGRLFKKGGGTGMTGRRNWKERYFVMALKGGGASTLKYYRPNGDNKRLGSVMLRDYAEVVEAAGDTGDTVKEKHQFRFNLVPREDSGADEKNRWLQLRAKSESEMREWIESLNTAIRLSDDEEGEEDQDDS